MTGLAIEDARQITRLNSVVAAGPGVPPPKNDIGTIVPSLRPRFRLRPRSVIRTLHDMFDHWPQLGMPYGFRDALNATAGWLGMDVIDVDQGPILLMIENRRTDQVVVLRP